MDHKNKLLPCPFCGTAMRIESNRDWHRLIGEHSEKCVFLDPETMMVPAKDDQLALIFEDWNTRAPAKDLRTVMTERIDRCCCPVCWPDHPSNSFRNTRC